MNSCVVANTQRLYVHIDIAPNEATGTDLDILAFRPENDIVLDGRELSYGNIAVGIGYLCEQFDLFPETCREMNNYSSAR